MARCGSAMTSIDASSVARLAVERGEALARGGAPHDDGRIRHARGVEGVQRMAELPQHVVGDVDHVADRPEPARPQARGHPGRRGRDLQPADHAQRVARAEVRRLHPDAGQRARRLPRLAQRDLRRAQPPAGQRGQLAGHAQHRQAVRPVGRDLDLEHVVVEAQVRDEVGAERGARVEQQQAPLMLFTQPQLALGAEHAVRFHAADLGDADRAATRERGAGRRERRPGAHRRVGRATHHRVARAPGADATQQHAVAVTVAHLALDGLDLADHDAAQIGRDGRHAGHLDPGVDQAVGGLLGRQIDVDQLAHPAVRDLHVRRTAAGSAGRSPETDGCRRCRT